MNSRDIDKVMLGNVEIKRIMSGGGYSLGKVDAMGIISLG